jgi:hypothetical protein
VGCFVLHAPRQTGKTTLLLALRDHLNARGDYRCVYVNVEVGQSAREDVTAAMRAILAQLGAQADLLFGDRFVAQHAKQAIDEQGAHGALGEVLTRWAAASPKPLVVLIDESDALVDVLAARRESVEANVRDHRRIYGRNFYSRHDYEGVDTDADRGPMGNLRGRLDALRARSTTGAGWSWRTTSATRTRWTAPSPPPSLATPG